MTTTRQYFLENKHSVTSPTILWEAYKTVLRGQAISLITSHKHGTTQQLRALEQAVGIAESAHSSDPNNTTTHKLNLAKQE